MKTVSKSILEIVADESATTFNAKLPNLVLSCLMVINAGKYGCLSGNTKTLRNAWGVDGCQNFVNEFFAEELWNTYDESNLPENFCHHCGELNPKWEAIVDDEENILHPCRTCGEEK